MFACVKEVVVVCPRMRCIPLSYGHVFRLNIGHFLAPDSFTVIDSIDSRDPAVDEVFRVVGHVRVCLHTVNH